jgi:hypothetical protein
MPFGLPHSRRNRIRAAAGLTLTAALAAGVVAVVASQSSVAETPPAAAVQQQASVIQPEVLSAGNGGAVAAALTVREAKIVRKVPVRYTVKKQAVPGLAKGKTRLLRAGHDGMAKVTFKVKYVNGAVANKTKVKRVVVIKPKAKIIGYGTGTGTRPSGTNASPAQAQAIAKQLLAQRGWSNQFSCLAQMWTRESGWNLHAQNSIGAYGIPQALPGNKMAASGSDYLHNAETQIKWGLNYIAGRYGTPCHAWSIWQTQSWY